MVRCTIIQQFCLLILLLATTLEGRIRSKRFTDENGTFPRSSVTNTTFRRTYLESLCVRMHNNTAFLGVDPYARLMVTSASDCRSHCINVFPKCKAIVFYYISGQQKQYACYLFDKNSINEKVALIAEKPLTADDKIRTLEVVINCHEFDPFPPLESEFVQTSDKVSKKKRDLCFDCPVPATGHWTPWSTCIQGYITRSQPCPYGRIIQRQPCIVPVTLGASGSMLTQSPALVSGSQLVYPPIGYVHISSNAPEYERIIASQRGIMTDEMCCARQNFYRNLKAMLINEAAGIMIPECPILCHYRIGAAALHIAQAPQVVQAIQPAPRIMHSIQSAPQIVRIVPPAPRTMYAVQRAPQIVRTIHPIPQIVHAIQRAPQVVRTFQQRPRVFHSIQPAKQVAEVDYLMRPSRVFKLVINAKSPLSAPYSKQISNARRQYRLEERILHRTETRPQVGPQSTVHERVEVPRSWTRLRQQPLVQGTERDSYRTGSQQRATSTRISTPSEIPRISQVQRTQKVDRIPKTRLVPGMPRRPQPEKNVEFAPLAIWDEWTEWSRCTHTCGAGVEQRYRNCKTSGCEGDEVEKRPCSYLKPCETWNMWTEWSDCSVTCGEGQRSRSRFCRLQEGNCEGESSETESCATDTPCAQWAAWKEWSECTKTCGGGIRSRLRECVGGHCPGEGFEETSCNTQICSTWSLWQEWSQCSASCGEGTRKRHRICLEETCEGPEMEEEDCASLPPCSARTTWNEWSSCSATCGKGVRVRSKECIQKEDCTGDEEETEVCSNRSCCEWSAWSSWSDCSKKCGGGDKVRTRLCQSPDLDENECVCEGHSDEHKSCNENPCSEPTIIDEDLSGTLETTPQTEMSRQPEPLPLGSLSPEEGEIESEYSPSDEDFGELEQYPEEKTEEENATEVTISESYP